MVENELIYTAWRDSESYQVPMTDEGIKLADMRFRAFKRGWEYAKFHTKHNDVFMKDYYEHGTKFED